MILRARRDVRLRSERLQLFPGQLRIGHGQKLLLDLRLLAEVRIAKYLLLGGRAPMSERRLCVEPERTKPEELRARGAESFSQSFVEIGRYKATV